MKEGNTETLHERRGERPGLSKEKSHPFPPRLEFTPREVGPPSLVQMMTGVCSSRSPAPQDLRGSDEPHGVAPGKMGATSKRTVLPGGAEFLGQGRSWKWWNLPPIRENPLDSVVHQIRICCLHRECLSDQDRHPWSPEGLCSHPGHNLTPWGAFVEVCLKWLWFLLFIFWLDYMYMHK